VQDLSRGGAALTCDIPLPAGTEVDVELPDTSGPVTARVVRSGGGVLAVVFHQDAAALEMIDRALDGLAGSRRAA
jgi:starvation-inducible outer membrane lipoprotein